MKAHSNNSKTFEELNYAQQASSISAQILSLEHAIIAHKRRALQEEGRDAKKTVEKTIEQVKRMLNRL